MLFSLRVNTDTPVSGEKVCVRQVLAGPCHILHLQEEVKEVLVKVQVEKVPGHLGALHGQLKDTQSDGAPLNNNLRPNVNVTS